MAGLSIREREKNKKGDLRLRLLREKNLIG